MKIIMDKYNELKMKEIKKVGDSETLRIALAFCSLLRGLADNSADVKKLSGPEALRWVAGTLEKKAREDFGNGDT